MVFKFLQSLHWKVRSGTCNLYVNRYAFASAKIMSTHTVSQIIEYISVCEQICDACDH